MKTFIFRRERNKFDDILKDKNIRKYIIEKYEFDDHLIIRVKDTPAALTYITLMYSEELISMTDIVPDRTPVMDVDYVPKNRKRLT